MGAMENMGPGAETGPRGPGPGVFGSPDSPRGQTGGDPGHRLRAEPIDLIPDFIPLLGQLDDLVLLPLGILLVRRLIPAALFDEWRSRVEQSPPQRRAALIGLGLLLVLACWATVIYGGWRWFRGGAT